MKVEFDTTTMSPWADLSRVLNNLRSLTIVAGGKTYSGAAVLEDPENDGQVTLTIGKSERVKHTPRGRVEGDDA